MFHSVVTKGAHELTLHPDGGHRWTDQVAFLYARHHDGEAIVGMYMDLEELIAFRDAINSEIARLEALNA